MARIQEKSSNSSMSSATTFRPELAFPYLTDDMLSRLRSYGREEVFPEDTLMFTRGMRQVDMFVILKGTVEIYVEAEGSDRSVVTTLQDGQFTGELDLLSSRQNLVEGRTSTICTLLRIDRQSFQRLMRSEGDIANLVMQATIWRRLDIVEQAFAGIRLIGRTNAAETIQLQRFLVRNGYPFLITDPEIDVSDLNVLALAADPILDELPAIVLVDGRILRKPTIAVLADELGITEDLDEQVIYDVIVVGAGPSGLATAVYAASEGLKTLVIDGIAPGGQAGTSSRIENYLGFPTGVSGQELANRAQVQAQKFGARIAISRDAIALSCETTGHAVTLDGGCKLQARTVVVATGAKYRTLAVENYSKFEYQGIHYAATAMEAALCRGQEVIVVGGGNSAGQAAVFLSGIAIHVHLLIRGSALSSTMSDYLIQRIENSSKITLHIHTEVEQLTGDKLLQCVAWRNSLTGVLEERRVRNMFVMVGAQPNTSWLHGCLILDEKGFVRTGSSVSAVADSPYATSREGIFAVGDVRSNSVKRVASAVGEGSVVVSDIHAFLR
jgi:thioredoxin reductase (NADPH)